MLTTLGILGTFYGIFLGLLDFDVRIINKSVPKLLEGLKLAFATSIWGLFLAIVYRVIRPVFETSGTDDDIGGEDIHKKLVDIETSIVSGFEFLGRTLSDDKDTSVVGQLARLRTQFSDKFDELI